MKLFTKTFGCQMNFADSDEMTRHLKSRGFTSTDDSAEADAVIANTCTVRELAEHKAMSFIGVMKDWKDARPNRLLIVTGCAAERAKDDLKRRFPHIDLIVGAKDIEKFPAELDEFLDGRAVAEETLIPSQLSGASISPVIQYVTIMRGCNYNCTYCIVPSVRAREIYRPVDEILRDVALRRDEGAREIWLLGQTVNSYRPSAPPRDAYGFADLLRDVAKTAGDVRIRFMSPHPYYLYEDLIRAMAELPNVCEHLHLPVQSGSNAVLQRMKRNYTRESYLASLKALREAIPSITVTTDIIVGFPGETEKDFQQTLALVEEAGFDSAYCFKYSPRPGTPSAQWPDDVDDEAKERRVNDLLAVTEAQGRAKAAALVGSVQEILIEEHKQNRVFRGKTRGAWRARLSGDLKIGQTVRAKIVGTHSRELHAELASASSSLVSSLKSPTQNPVFLGGLT